RDPSLVDRLMRQFANARPYVPARCTLEPLAIGAWAIHLAFEHACRAPSAPPCSGLSNVDRDAVKGSGREELLDRLGGDRGGGGVGGGHARAGLEEHPLDPG